MAELLAIQNEVLLQKLRDSHANTAAAISKLKSQPFLSSNNGLSTKLREESGNIQRSHLNPNKYIQALPDGVRFQNLLKEDSNIRPNRKNILNAELEPDPILNLTPDKDSVMQESLHDATGSGMLGYDWIAGMMDNDTSNAFLCRPDSYFSELQKFRLDNKEDCIAEKFRHEAYSLADKIVNPLGPPSAWDGSRSGDKKKSVEESPIAFTVNERLIPVPVNPFLPDRDSSSCAAPRIIKVSIPLSRLRHVPRQFKSLNWQVPGSPVNPPPRLKPNSSNSLSSSHGTCRNDQSMSLLSHCINKTELYSKLPHRTHILQEATNPLVKKLNSPRDRSSRDEFLTEYESLDMKSIPERDTNTNSCHSTSRIVPAAAGLLSCLQQEQGQFSHLFVDQPRSEDEAINLLRRGRTGTSQSLRLTPQEKEIEILDRTIIPISMASRSALKSGHDAIENMHRRPRGELLETCKRIRQSSAAIRRSVRFKD